MRAFVIAAVAAAFLPATPSLAQVKKVPYAEVKVEVPELIAVDPAIETMRKAFADAVAKKDAEALFALLSPTFVWLSQNTPYHEFDMGRDAVHNFKVAFGFRDYGTDTDGNVPDGPYWNVLAAFANDATYFQDIGNLICGPLSATYEDDAALGKAQKKIGADESVEWYFTLAETTATQRPGSGQTVGKVGTSALPILSKHPAAKEGEADTPTHLEVLLPNGKSGWIANSAARPFPSESLCYSKTVQGEWKISAYDQAPTEEE
jgi:hypothetical protein